jgi:hypothetical protein
MSSKPPTQAELDHLARAQGFPDAATMIQWHQNYSAGPATQGQGAAAPAAHPLNYLQSLLSHIPIHPAYLIQHVADAYGKATGQ